MAQHPVEHERRSRKKQSLSTLKPTKPRESSKRPQPTPVVTEVFLQDYAPPSQVSSTCVGSVQQQPYYQAPTRPPPMPPVYSAAPVQHPVYGQMPGSFPEYNPSFGSPPAQPSRLYASQSTVRIASPPRHEVRGEGPWQQQWDRFDRMAAKSYSNLREGAVQSVNKLTTNYVERPTHAVAKKSMHTLCRGAALCDIISSKFDAVVTSIDDQCFSGKEQDLVIYDDEQRPQRPPTSRSPPSETKGRVPQNLEEVSRGCKGSNYFSKVWLYSNSRLPPHLPPFKVYIPTYPLLCLAATYSEKAYTRPESKKAADAETHISADWRTGTKAMVLKAIPVEDLNTIVFAIRGSQTFMDWAVNYNSDPSSPKHFLDDPSNLCHAGFLYVAKRMVKPVADRLRVLLQENPARSNCSLLITGHSAGGAVAALLYAHMMSTKTTSDLTYLTGFFKRVHCITFGAPPVSLRPLKKPEDKRHHKSLFYSFINEGDPIPRADKSVLKSLLKLYTSPAPSSSALGATITSMSKLNLSHPAASSPPKSKLKVGFAPRLRPSKISLQTNTTTTSSASTQVTWEIPACSLSPAGRLVVLRRIPGSRREEDVEAVTVDDAMLGKVVYGDLMKHQMKMYKSRIDWVATRAVTAEGC
ncbi:hypothetical protein ACN47E_007572 [Coniothyrium glycines]